MTEPDILTPKEACGCGLVLGTLVAIAVAAYLLCGCRTYTVVPADREVVPVKALRAGEQRTERAGPKGQTFHGHGEQNAPAGRRIDLVRNEKAKPPSL